ncbi:MAG: ATP synthase F1 subunit epsilon [Polyangiaceae bacterium]|nr:ATP synthase F1 subunit epsilon [Polyangiaceae bacterium]
MVARKLRVRAPGKIRLEVVTPEGSTLDEDVDEFTSPSARGQFGVLPGHLPLLAALRTGIVTYRKDEQTVSFAVGPGIVEVADDHAILLTDKLFYKESIDVVSVRMQLKELVEKLEGWTGDPGTPEHSLAIGEEQWLAVLMELFGDQPPPTMRPMHLITESTEDHQEVDS